MVVERKALVKGVKGEEKVVKQSEVACFNAKEYYRGTNVGSGHLLILGNRAEAFGGPHVTLKN